MKLLREQQVALGYTSAGLSAASMRMRLEDLHKQLGERYDECGELDDDDGCALCDEYQTKIMDILDSNEPLGSVSEKMMPTGSLAPSLLQHSKSNPELATAANMHDNKSELDSVLLQKCITEGKSSSGNSWIVNGLLTDALTGIKTEVVVKLLNKDLIDRLKKEYRIMNVLHKKDQDRFITPYSFLDGSKGQILGYEGEDCSIYIGIAMEMGICSMREKLQEDSELSINDVKVYAEKLLKVVIVAAEAKVVLMDFKLANVVLVYDRRAGIRTKAIDFDCSRNLNELISTETSSCYSCPEVAKWVVKGCLSSETPKANSKMDIMAYGFCIFEIASILVYGESKTFWGVKW